MRVEKDTLVLFTLHYPYSKVSETFLDPEIEILAKRFDRVIVVPWKREVVNLRELPDNVHVENVLLDLNLEKDYRRLYLKHFRHWFLFLRIYCYSIINDKPKLPYFRSAYFLYNLVNAFERSLLLRKYIQSNKLGKAIFYDYWFENSTLSLAILKDLGVISRFYNRSHGFDAFDDRWDCGAVPFKSYKLMHTDKHFTISEYNSRNIKGKTKKILHPKIEVSYLGVKAPLLKNPKVFYNANKTYTVVSCSNLLGFKQVHRMPELLNLVNLSIRWYHFGDGPMREMLIRSTKKLDKKIEFNFMGHIDHDMLLKFYRENEVGLFISLSTKEGLPVSMVEALSYGIPLAGYRVFGIPEIINSDTGILFDIDDEFSTMANKIRNLLTHKQKDQDRIFKEFTKKFEAERNYNAMISIMLNNN